MLCTTAQAAALRDIESHPYRESIEQLTEKGVVHGYSDGTFKPNLPINRAEFLKILMLAVHGDRVFETGSTACFFDFGTAVEWYYPHACTAKELGIIDGYPDGTFRGESTVNLAEALKMSLEAWGVPLPQYIRAPDNWYDPYVDAAANTGVFQFIPLVPDFPLTRGEAAELLVKLRQPLATLDSEASNPEKVVISRQQIQQGVLQQKRKSVCGNGILEKEEQCDDGNVLNDDGCSELCILVAQPVRHGALRIEQRPMGTLSIAKGAKDVSLIAFDAVAGRQDVYLTQLKFKADVGSLTSGRNYSLYYDSNGDSTAEKLLATAVPQNEKLAFGNLSIPVRDGFYTRVELRGDIASSGTVNDFSVQFDTADPDYIQGVDTIDGEDVVGIETDDSECQLVSICWISVYTKVSRLISIGSQGSLFVTESNSPVGNKQLLAGTLSDTLLRLTFRATEEDIAITKLTIGGGTDSVDSLELFLSGGTAPFAVARKASCDTVATGQFCADIDFVVPRDTEQHIIVRARVKTDSEGGTSGDTVSLTLTANTSSNVAVQAWGEASLKELNQNNGNVAAEGEIIIGRDSAGANIAITGTTNDIVAAKFASIQNSHGDPDETSVPTGETTFATFRFAALPNSNSFAGHNNIVIDSITFNVTSINVEFSGSSFVLYNTQNPSVTVACTGSTTGIITVVCSNLESSAVSSVIAQGSSIELALRGDITNPQIGVGTSTLQAQISGFGNRTASGPIEWHDEVFPFQWVDLNSSTIRSTLYRISN